MEYWKAFENLNKLMENDFWKGDHVPPAPSKPWLEYIYIVKIIPNNKITINLQNTDIYKIGWSNDTSPLELKERIKKLNSELGKVRLLYRWRVPAAQTFEKFIKDFLINFRRTKDSLVVKRNENEQKTTEQKTTEPEPAKGFTEIIYNIPITTLVHIIQLCIIFRATDYLTDKTNVDALSDMRFSPTTVQDATGMHSLLATPETNIVFNYTDVFKEIHRYTSFSIYPQRCVDWDWDGQGGPPEKFKEYIMNYRPGFEQKYDFDSGDDGDFGDAGDDAGDETKTAGGGGVAGGKTGDLLPLVLYALRF